MMGPPFTTINPSRLILTSSYLFFAYLQEQTYLPLYSPKKTWNHSCSRVCMYMYMYMCVIAFHLILEFGPRQPQRGAWHPLQTWRSPPSADLYFLWPSSTFSFNGNIGRHTQGCTRRTLLLFHVLRRRRLVWGGGCSVVVMEEPPTDLLSKKKHTWKWSKWQCS